MTALRDKHPDLPALLEAIRRRPGMYLGEKTILGLSLLLSGIGLAEDLHGIPEDCRIGGFDFPAFEKWVEAAYNPRRLSHNSMTLAAALAESVAAGFDLWFGWYDEFRAKPPIA